MKRPSAGLVFSCTYCYCPIMLARIRRPIALLLALALAMGLATHSVPAANSDGKAVGMTAGMSMDAAMDMPTDKPMPGKCNGCAGDEKAMMPPACSAFCGSVVALPLVPVDLNTVPVATVWPAAGTVGTGHTGPPDPYPPKPVVLS